MKNGQIRLRYIKASDIANYERWTTTETEWWNWDAPWEEDDDDDEFFERQKFLLTQEPHFYSKLEIETASGEHIGWVSCYDIDFEDDEVTAVGMNIPAIANRGKGYGAGALTAYMGTLV
ncbi:MAG: GNAT family N-acetyltransferase [Defluviitaleaceae bacterium]|nr:GNAT family N-acetyltransferase [Defluviitaleaceae bacterium]MCL2240209.1 GNAT family N-acetyltransferase [Defluviitaleaceae bacterium]